jgi:hypothetical protein
VREGVGTREGGREGGKEGEGARRAARAGWARPCFSRREDRRRE